MSVKQSGFKPHGSAVAQLPNIEPQDRQLPDRPTNEAKTTADHFVRSGRPPLHADFPPLDGSVAFDPTTRQNVAGDYGNFVQAVPSAVAKAASVDDVVKVLKYAHDAGIAVAPRGAGHMTEGQAQTAGGIVLLTGGLPKIMQINDANGAQPTVTLSAGQSWKDVVTALDAQGLRVPVLPDYLGQTVGGTLSSAGVGKGSHTAGTQLDLVESMEVVTGTGERVRVSRNDPDKRKRELFNSALGGLGQVAVITEVTLRVEPRKPFVTQVSAGYANVTDLVADLGRAANEPGNYAVEGLNGSSNPGFPPFWLLTKTIESDAPLTPAEAQAAAEKAFSGYKVIPGTVSGGFPTPAGVVPSIPYLSFALNFEQQPDFAQHWNPDINGGKRPTDLQGQPTYQPWFDVFLSANKTAGFAGSAVEPSTLGPDGLVLLIPTRAVHTPAKESIFQLPTGVKPGDVYFEYGLVQSTTTKEDNAARLEHNKQLANGALGAGGKLYVIDNTSDADIWREHLGTAGVKAVAEAKKKFDPKNILTPMPNIPTH